jgi:hypothetical protein
MITGFFYRIDVKPLRFIIIQHHNCYSDKKEKVSQLRRHFHNIFLINKIMYYLPQFKAAKEAFKDSLSAEVITEQPFI